MSIDNVDNGAFMEGLPPKTADLPSIQQESWWSRFRTLILLAGIGVGLASGYFARDLQTDGEGEQGRALVKKKNEDRLKELSLLVADVIEWRDAPTHQRIGALNALEEVAKNEAKAFAGDPVFQKKAQDVADSAKFAADILKRKQAR